MMFSENISAEMQEILELELHRYKREIGHMTDEEWNCLVDWVYSGHSPYMNGDGIFDDDGWPLDYINTLRFWDSQKGLSDGISEEQKIPNEHKKIVEIQESDGFIFPEGFIESLEIQLN